MRKATFVIALCAIILSMFISCGTTAKYDDIFIDPNFVEIDEYDASLTRKGSANPLVTERYLAHAVLNPWRENASKTAAATGTMRFYCMCATGHSNTPSWGDSCLIAFPNGELMLIDAGVEGFGAHLVRNLRALGVEKIDYLVFTHPHDDHCWGVTDTSFLDQIEVGICYYSGAYNEGWSNPKRIEQVMKAHNVPCQIMGEGDTLEIGDVKLTWLAPVKADVVGKYFSGNTNVNNLSMAIRFDYGELSALMAGDIEYDVESRLLKQYGDTGLLDVDIFKISHHGSTTSNQKEFLQAVSPEVAFVYGGAPITTALYGQLAKLGCFTYCDGIDGYIRIVGTKDGDITVDTSHPRETKLFDNLDSVAQKVRDGLI